MSNPIIFIRTYIFGESQDEFAKALRVTQPTVSRWERQGHCHYDNMLAIRKRAVREGKPWDDSYFFEVPSEIKAKESNGRERPKYPISQSGKTDQPDEAPQGGAGIPADQRRDEGSPG